MGRFVGHRYLSGRHAAEIHQRNVETGSGDWTKDRKKILEKDPDKIIKSIMERRKKVPAPGRARP